MTMHALSALRARIRALLIDHRESRPSTPREAVVWLLEVWLAFGLILRAISHMALYVHERTKQGYHPSEVHPLDIEYGLEPGLAVRDDALEEPFPRADKAPKIQGLTPILVGFPLVHYAMLATVSNPLMATIILAPPMAVPLGDPLWGLLNDLVSTYNGPTERDNDAY